MPEVNPAAVDGGMFRALGLGFRTERAAAALPQSTQAPLFTVTGGRVAIRGIVGEVTVAIQNQANNTKLVGNPTTGTDVDLCAVLNIANKEVGALFGITGLFSDAMVGANAGAGVLPRNPVVVPIGSLDLSCAASNTGSVKWTVYWTPLDEGAALVAA